MLDASTALCVVVSFVKFIVERFYTLCKQISVFFRHSDFRSVEPTHRETGCVRLSPIELVRQGFPPFVDTSVYFSKPLAIRPLRTPDDPPQFWCIGHAGPFTTVSLQTELNFRYFRYKRKGRCDRACFFKRYVSSIERIPEKGSERRRVP